MTGESATFCARCGSRMRLAEVDGRLRLHCPDCGFILYENPVPGVGVLIEHGDSIVLVQRDRAPHIGGWALPGGFIEADERVEQAAVREALEETNLDIELLELFGVYSFPEGPPRSGLIIFYRARARDITALRPGDDARGAALFTADALPDVCFRTHREVIGRWLGRRRTAAADAQPAVDAPPAGLTIRRAKPSDIDRVLDLLALIPARGAMTPAERVQLIERIRGGQDLEQWVAEATDVGDAPAIVGFIALSMPTTLMEPRAWVDAQVVEPGYRRRGVGRALFEAALRRARERGAATLLVDVTRGNSQAQEFYHACGFGAAGTVEQVKVA